MPLPPSRRDIIGPPRPGRDVSNLSSLVRHHDSYLRSLDAGFLGGRFATPSPVRGSTSQLVGEDGSGDAADEILFCNTDVGICSGDGAAILIPLSYVPEDGSEQVFYNGTPLKRTDWSRTDTVLTIPGESWFRNGKAAWVDYAYYEAEPNLDPAAFVSVSTLSGTYTSIPLPAPAPGTSGTGDMLVLAMRGRDAATCSDARMSAKYVDGGGKWGSWVGSDNGSGLPLSINLSGVSGSDDACAALMRISGDPLLPVTAEASSSGSGGTFTPTMPTAGSFGVIAITSGVGLVAASVSEDALANWTTRARIRGSGPGFASVYLGTAVGVPAGQWSNAGGTPTYSAWAGGIQ